MTNIEKAYHFDLAMEYSRKNRPRKQSFHDQHNKHFLLQLCEFRSIHLSSVRVQPIIDVIFAN